MRLLSVLVALAAIFLTGCGDDPTYTGTVYRTDNSASVGGASVSFTVAGKPFSTTSDSTGSFLVTVAGQKKTESAVVTVTASGFKPLTRSVLFDPKATNLGRFGLDSEPPPPPETWTGTVVGGDIDTGLFARRGDTIQVTASGKVDFGGAVLGIGAPILEADGDNQPTPSDYPCQGCRKNSLIFRIGAGPWHYCGTSTTFTADLDGKVGFRANDKDVGDNSRGWGVTLTLTRK